MRESDGLTQVSRHGDGGDQMNETLGSSKSSHFRRMKIASFGAKLIEQKQSVLVHALLDAIGTENEKKILYHDKYVSQCCVSDYDDKILLDE